MSTPNYACGVKDCPGHPSKYMACLSAPAPDGKKVIVGVPSTSPAPHINPITEPQRRGP